MTAKEFFKSTTFRCLATLLSILLVCGVFLTIMYGLLEVTPEEKLARAISKIYGKNVTAEVQEVKTKELDNATIEEAYCITSEGGDYLVKSTGKGGFAGTVTCWVVVEVSNGNIDGVGKVTIDSYVGETQMAEIKQSFLDSFGEKYVDGIYYTTDDGFKVSSSTKSSNAICNAVNGALQYVKTEKLGMAANDIFKDFVYTSFINKKLSSFVLNKNDSVSYSLVTAGYGYANPFTVEITVSKNKTISAYTVVKDGSTYDYDQSIPADIKNGTKFLGRDLKYFTDILGGELTYPGDYAGTEINTGASNSTYILFTAAAFALANYDNAMATKDVFENFDYLKFISKDKSKFEVNADNSVKYTLVTAGYGYANPFTIEITVGADKTISAYTIVKDGSTEGFGNDIPDKVKDGSKFIDKDLKYFTDILGGELTYPGDYAGTEINTGASNSTYILFTAAAFALANYDNCIPETEEGGEANE